jgi:hypothetical protein
MTLSNRASGVWQRETLNKNHLTVPSAISLISFQIFVITRFSFIGNLKNCYLGCQLKTWITMESIKSREKELATEIE